MADCTYFKARRGGVLNNVFQFHIHDGAAEDKQVGKNRIKIRPFVPEISRAKV